MNYFLCELIIVQEFNRFKYCRIYNPRNDLVYNVLGIILYMYMYLNYALGNMLLRFIIVVSVAVCSSFFFSIVSGVPVSLLFMPFQPVHF